MRVLRVALFAAAAVFLFFFCLHRIPLWSSDEGRYGEIAREAFESGDYVVTKFNGVDYLEKPVLAPILTAAAYAVFGVSSFSARLVSVLSALAGILLCWFFVRRLWSRAVADLSALILLTSVGYVLVGRFAVIDMLMTFLMSASLFCLMTAYFEKKTRIYLAAYVFMGLAFLTKGLIGFVLPGLIFFIFLILMKDLREIFRMKLVWGALIIAAIIVPWFAAVMKREPEFFDVFIVKHHLERFATNTFGRKKSFWFYVPILFATVFPWSLFLLSAVVRAIRHPDREEAKKLKFLLVWAAVIFVFFSLPRAKLPYYLLPLSMPVAILIASFFRRWQDGLLPEKTWEGTLARGAWKAVLISCTLLFFILNPVLYFLLHDPEINALRPLVLTGTALIMSGSLVVYSLYVRGKLLRAVWALAGLTYLTLIFTVLGMKIISPYQSTAAFARGLLPMLRPEDKVAIFSSPDHFSDFMFHLRRRVIVVGSDRGTLTAESKEPDHFEDTRLWFYETHVMVEAFKKAEQRFYVLLDMENLVKLEDLGIAPYRVLQKSGQKLLITNDLDSSLDPTVKNPA